MIISYYYITVSNNALHNSFKTLTTMTTSFDINNKYVQGLIDEIITVFYENASDVEEIIQGASVLEEDIWENTIEIDTFLTEDNEEIGLGLELGEIGAYYDEDKDKMKVWVDGGFHRYEGSDESDYVTCYTGQDIIEKEVGVTLDEIINNQEVLKEIEKRLYNLLEIAKNLPSDNDFDPWTDLGNTYEW